MSSSKLLGKIAINCLRPVKLYNAACRPTAVKKLLSLHVSARLRGKAAWQGCWAWMPDKAAGQGCRARLPGKAAGHGCMVQYGEIGQ
jgi:hypothetical protein